MNILSKSIVPGVIKFAPDELAVMTILPSTFPRPSFVLQVVLCFVINFAHHKIRCRRGLCAPTFLEAILREAPHGGELHL